MRLINPFDTTHVNILLQSTLLHYNSNLDYHYISLDYSPISVEIDYQNTPEVIGQEIEETSYKKTKTKEQIRSKNHNWS